MARWKPDAQGRLTKAALALFDQQGYDETTIADIASSAGLTKRTFFRYFADKREVLFSGAEELERLWVTSVQEAPEGVSALAVVGISLDAVAEMFVERHPFVQIRARIIATNPELQERELIKLERLASSLAASFEGRGVNPMAAALAAQTSVRVFHTAFVRWIAQEDPAALRGFMHEALDELKELLAT